MIQVDQNTIVEVGKMYKVRCARISNDKVDFFIPVIGEPHTDKQFGFIYKHIHIDGRFIGKDCPSYFRIDDNGKTNDILGFDREVFDFTVKEIVVKKRKCRRLTTGINPPTRQSGLISHFHVWYDSMVGKSCKGKKCPHLGHTMVEENGRLVCPLHNLQGCIKTEVIIPYTKQ